VFAFPVRPRSLPEGVFFGVRGSTAPFTRALMRLARRLGGRGMEIRKGRDAAYHLACVGAGNFLFAQMAFARAMLQRAVNLPKGMSPEEALLPLLEGAVENLRTDGLAQGMTGPVARGDRGTLALHVDYLRRSAPAVLPYYREAVRLLRKTLAGR